MPSAGDSGRPLAVGRIRFIRPGSWSLWSYAPRVIGFVLTVEVLAVGLAMLFLFRVPVVADEIPVFVALLALCIGYAEATRRIERLHRQAGHTPHIDLNSVWTFAGALLLHPALAASVSIAAHVHQWVRLGHRPAHRLMFSMAAAICSVLAAAGVLMRAGHFRAFAGIPHDGVGLLVIAAAGGVLLLVNGGLVGMAITLSTANPSLRTATGGWRDHGVWAATVALGALLAWALVDWPVLAVLIVGVTVVLHRAVLVPPLREQASTDAKTGLLNTAAWYQLARQELDRARRQRAALGVLIIDLDHFKRVNDGYGHLAGDEVLVAVAGSITAHVRAHDVVGRFGGEEFVVLLPGLDCAGVAVVAERVRAGVSGLALRVTGLHGAVPLSGLTASVGVAAFPRHGDGVDALLRASDEALFAAKSGGRNQVWLAAPVTAGRSRTLG